MPSDYVHVFYNNTVPASCCNKNIVGDRCDLIRQNSTGRIDEIYQNVSVITGNVLFTRVIGLIKCLI